MIYRDIYASGNDLGLKSTLAETICGDIYGSGNDFTLNSTPPETIYGDIYTRFCIL